VGDTWNNRSELRVEWRKLHYHMLHDLYGTLPLLVLMLRLLVKERESMHVRVCMDTHTHTTIYFSATAFLSQYPFCPFPSHHLMIFVPA
jgi:hypothetical protein